MSESDLLIRDPLYGLIQITPPELSILKSIPVTRMRWIKQMGLACLVFPGANHTRFEHSIGTMFVANKLIDALINKTKHSFLKENVQAIRLVALLHDLGHSPFSHVTEEFFRRNPKYLPAHRIDYDHETYTETIIRNNMDVRTTCKEEGINLRFVSKLATGRSGTFLDSLLSSAIDVDKIDYVARDSYFCGLPYGRVDLSSLTEGITLTKSKSGKEILAFDRKSKDAVEGLLMSRFYLATTIHVDERNCAANQLLFSAMTSAYELILKPATKEELDNDIKELILDSLHYRWVDHDLIMFLEDPFQKLRIAAIEASREKFSPLNFDTLQSIIRLMSAQPIRHRTRYLSHMLLNRVLRGKIPQLRHSVSLTRLPPLTRYSLYILYSLSDYTEYISRLKKAVQRMELFKGIEIFVDITALKPSEINTKIVTHEPGIKNLFDMSLIMRSLAIETTNRLTLSIYSYHKILDRVRQDSLESLAHVLCDQARYEAIKKREYVGTDLILMLHYSLYREREFFESDTRFQALFAVMFDKLLDESHHPYKELIELPDHFGDLNEARNYEVFRKKGYPEFYSVKFAQDLEMLAEMGLIYSRSGPVPILGAGHYAKRYERRISRHGRNYVENFLLERYPFSNTLQKRVKKALDSDTPLISMGM